MPSPIFTSLLLVLMIQKTHGREIQYLKQEGLLSRRLSSSLSPARLRFLAACWVTLLWQLSVGWELHHGANDRIIMKRLTSDVLERRARCQGTKPARCSAWRRLYNTYPRHHEHRERTSPSFLCGGLTLAPTTPLPPPPPPPVSFPKGETLPAEPRAWRQRGSVSECLERRRCDCWPWARTRSWDLARDAAPGDGREVGERGPASPNWPDMHM